MRRRENLVSWKLSIIQRLVDRERRKLDTYSCKCINFGRSKTQAFFKNMEKFILCLDQIVRWVMGSFEFLTRDYYFFVRRLNSRGVSYQGQWSMVPLYDRDGLPCSRKAKSFADVVLEVERAYLPWMLLTSFVFRNGQTWVTVLLFSSFPWFWACHQHDEELVHVA